MRQPIQRIKTNIKFYKGLNNSSRVCGFVTKSKGSWRGCRVDDDCKKKIVLVDGVISKFIIPNALYQCVLVPMRNDGGFIAVSAVMQRFKAMIDTIYRDGEYIVRVRFGNKCIVYDPNSRDPRRKNIAWIAKRLRNRIDLANPIKVAEDFINTACMVSRLYNQKRISDVYRENVK